jgi:hypothetical protein
MSATTTQLLSSGKFCKLRYYTIPVESASANVSFYTNNSKMENFEFVPLLSQMIDISVQQEPTGCTICSQIISLINLYMFRAGLLLIIRSYNCVYHDPANKQST